MQKRRVCVVKTQNRPCG